MVWILSAGRAIGRFFILITKPFKKITLGLGKAILWILTPLYSLYFKIKILYKKISWPKYRKKLGQDIWFIIWVLIGLCLLTYELSAPTVKAEQYGQNNLLFSITRFGENYESDADFLITEGPLAVLPQNTNSVDQGVLSESIDAPEPNTEITTAQPIGTEDHSVLGEPTTVDLPAKPRTQIETYVVAPGDVLSTIARKFSISLNTLMWENGLTALSRIKPGQKLRILPTNGLSYKVVKGDTLKKIGTRYKVSDQEIALANNLSINTKLSTGQILLIPGGIKPKIVEPAKPKAQTIKQVFTARPDDYEPAAESATHLLWPTNSRRITQYFRWRHTGLDIGNAVGQPIYAAEDGVVIKAQGGYNGGYGNYIVIDHGNGLQTAYGHSSVLYVEPGESVSRGQVISAAGSTGRSTGPHLHFEVRKNGVRVNPLSYIR